MGDISHSNHYSGQAFAEVVLQGTHAICVGDEVTLGQLDLLCVWGSIVA